MSSPYIVLKQETRMFGAAQVMNGLIHFALGHIWMQLYIRQNELFLLTYLPIVLISGYPFGASFFYVVSGIFAIEAEKRRSPKLLKYTIKTNIYCSVLSVIGIFLTVAEITLFLVKPVKIQWPQESGIILSVYVCIFSIFELYLANTVAKWGIDAFRHSNYLT
ncbi:membrane-spanning 4-domains subfamily A member 6D-like [Molossus molossus]|uniref:Membrane spanning 4-domains A5 n=1 Tax=Molossus molossus TaxID=27622 RepID=A0A7J8ESK7_MOLMO|nr:membrane-spanning 4-domains subfamily A member 6D-like [Molossus molossus]KAF6438301.1 hypothetical protein HJG59_012524 [Molossus molossus]